MLPNDVFKAGRVPGALPGFMLPEPYRGAFVVNGPLEEIRRVPLSTHTVDLGDFKALVLADSWNDEKIRWPQQPGIIGEIRQNTVYGAYILFMLQWPSRNIMRWVPW